MSVLVCFHAHPDAEVFTTGGAASGRGWFRRHGASSSALETVVSL